MAPEEMQSFIFLPIIQHEKNLACKQLKDVVPPQATSIAGISLIQCPCLGTQV